MMYKVIMLWSTKSSDLRRTAEYLRRSPDGFSLTRLLEEPLEKSGIPHNPVNYKVISPLEHGIVPKIVVPYVHLDSYGMLSDNHPSFYAVTKRPDTHGYDKPAVTRRSQEAHVVAEDFALRRGIFTLYARANSEQLVALMITEGYREGYLLDRMAHVEALKADATEHQDLLKHHQLADLTRELDRGLNTLSTLKSQL